VHLHARFILVLKTFFSRSLSLHSHLPLAQAHFLELATWCLAVIGGGSVGECGKLSQSSWLLGGV